MKIVHLCLTFDFMDGAGYQENLIAKYHRKMGNQVTVIAYERPGKHTDNKTNLSENAISDNGGIQVVRLKRRKGKLFQILRLFHGLTEQLEHEAPDILFLHGCQFLDIFNVIRYVKKRPYVKVFVDNHADHVNSARNLLSENILHKGIWKRCAKAIEPYTEKFFGVTPSRCEFLKEMYRITPEKIALLVMGADDEKINFNAIPETFLQTRKALNLKEEDFVLVTGGKIDRNKNIHLLMQAVREINREHLKLIVFGTPTAEMQAEFTQLSDFPQIISLGWIPSDGVYPYFLCSNLAVFPGTHSVLWEQAVGSGVPCLFKCWDGIDHVDRNGNCRFLYHDSVDEIKEMILNIMENPSVYAHMQAVAQGKEKKKFWYSEIAKNSIATTENETLQQEDGEIFAAKSVANQRKVF